MENVFLTSLTVPEVRDLFRQELSSFIKDIKQQTSPHNQIKDEWFDLDSLRNYHPDKPAAATVYGWVAKNEIPYHKRGKKLSFLKSEIDLWLKAGRKKTIAEIDAAADEALNIKQHA